MIRKYRKLFFLCALLCFGGNGNAQNVALKTNMLYWGTTTPNASIEVGLSRKFTTDWQLAYNPWTFKDDRKMRFWLVQPELRYWFCESFEGHFVGIHLHGAQYYGGFSDKRYDGYLAGGGVTYGYNWILSSHWNLEALIGAGYARLWYTYGTLGMGRRISPADGCNRFCRRNGSTHQRRYFSSCHGHYGRKKK